VPGGQQADERLLGIEAATIVQEQDRRTLAGLEQFKLDAGDRDGLPLQGTPSWSWLEI
jgi:hypothetical protein